MKKGNKIIKVDNLQDKIYTIRGMQVMLDSDLATLYQVEVKRLNEQVKRNKERFPERFCFQITMEEFDLLNIQKDNFSNLNKNPFLRSQIATSKKHGGRRYLPFVFTEQGVTMLATVLRSKIAVQVSIQIMDAFVQMRKILTLNAGIFNRLETVEQKQIKTDKKVDKILNALEDKTLKPKQGIFYNGQIFDAYILASKIIRSANKRIVLVDNYIDESVLKLFSKRNKKVKVIIYTKRISKILIQDLEKYNQQYQDKKIEIKTFKKSHDRFIIIDNKTIYHLGASLKDLGKKWFAFSKLEIEVKDILKKLANK
jgi:hypothetical protein